MKIKFSKVRRIGDEYVEFRKVTSKKLGISMCDVDRLVAKKVKF